MNLKTLACFLELRIRMDFANAARESMRYVPPLSIADFLIYGKPIEVVDKSAKM